MILKSIIKKIFVAAFALLVFQQVWAEENSENRTAKVRVLVTPGGEWKGKFPPQFALWIQDSDGNFSRTIFATKSASKKNGFSRPKAAARNRFLCGIIPAKISTFRNQRMRWMR